MGLPLVEDEFNINTITREIFSRITAQMYDILGIYLGPAVFSCKVIMSRICKITSLTELNKPIYEIDPNLATTAYKFLVKLKDLHKIQPFPASFVSLCFASGALGRKTIPSHEIHSRVHGLASVKKILNYINFHQFISNRQIQVISLGDSLAVAQLFNPRLSVRKIYL